MPILTPYTGEHPPKLKNIDPEHTGKWNRDSAQERLAELGKELVEMQSLLYATAEVSLLIVLQGMDTAGKDGAIRGLSRALELQGTRVASFKVPTEEERGHDFLWRVHAQTPRKNEIVIFNRSHYEDVLVVRVHKLVPEPVWKGRYEQICNFESLLTDNQTIIMKFFLHISKDQQERRLLEREKDPTKSWKLSVGDWQERELWDDYQEAYADALRKTATPNAPWYVVPANNKWFRDLAIADAIVERLRPYKKDWLSDLTARGETAKADIAKYRQSLTQK